MRNSVSEFIKQLTSRAVLKIFESLLAALGASLLGFIGSEIVWDQFKSVLYPYRIGLIFAVIFLLSAALIFIYLRFNKYIPHIPKIKSKLHFLSRELYYKYHSREKMILTEKITVKATAEFRTHIFKFHWGGSNYAIKSNKYDHTLTLLPRKGPYERIELDFNRSISIGEEVDIELIYELEDEQRIAPTLLNQKLAAPCKKLSFSIEIPPKLGIVQVRKQRYYIDSDDNVDNMGVSSLDSDGRMTWVIPDPKLLYTYEIYWLFPK